MKKVLIKRNYSFPNLLRQTSGGNGIWGDFEFVYEGSTCDFLVVLNHPMEDISVRCPSSNKLLIIQEPPYEINEYLQKYFKYFNLIVSDFKTSNPKNQTRPAGLPWHINKTYDELVRLKPGPKKDEVSWVTSNSNLNPGHEPRLKLLEGIRQSDLPNALFGRGIAPIDDKFDGIYPYKYTLAVENYSAPNYWTEKIADAFLSWSMPIYFGCKNIYDYFPEDSLILIDIYDVEGSIEKMKTAIRADAWSNNLKAIEEARNLVLNEYQFFPFITKLLQENSHKFGTKRVSVRVPVNPDRSFIKRVKKRTQCMLRFRK